MELIFLHITKTGGRTIEAVLKEIYGEANIFTLKRKSLKGSPRNLEEVIPPGKKVLHGIMWFSELSAFYEKNPAPLITWLRDPVERVISNYYYMLRRVQRGRRSQSVRLKDETLIGYAARKGKRNLMAQFLKGVSLRDLFFVGLLEHLTEDLNDLGRLLRWGREAEPVHRNDNCEFRSQFPPVSPAIREEIKKLNQEDVELYHEALSLRQKRRQLLMKATV
jgi:hypothetical protein